ncbi:MAG TPA: hypothetical protein VKV19_05725 [Ktedonobacteraceae bacterium]|nr:hypothetical protein [Ktedonobacteraceae bacterium]
MKTLWRHLAFFTLAALVAMALVCGTELGKSATAHATSEPTITLSASTVKAGHAFTLTGQGFAPDEYLSITFSFDPGNAVGLVGCNESGLCVGPAYVPSSDVVEGHYTVTATGTESGLMAQAPIRVTPGISVAIQGTSGAKPEGGPGTPLRLSGDGFLANETVAVYWGSAPSGILEGTTTIDAQGNLSFNFDAPTGITPGSYRISVARTSRPVTVTTTFAIVKPKAYVPSKFFGPGGMFFSYVGFQSGEVVNAFWGTNANTQEVYTGHAGSDGGSDSLQFMSIPLVPNGTYTLTFVGESSGISLSYPVAIVPGLVLNPNASNPGNTIAVNGYGYSANEMVSVFFQTPSNGVVTATTDATGSFTALLPLPDTFNPQTTYDYTVYAKNTAKTETAKAAFSFLPIQLYMGSPVQYGDSTNLQGQGFLSNETVNIYWNYQQAGQILVGTVTAATDGTFSLNVTVPSDPAASQGQVNVAAIGQTSQLVATTTIQETNVLLLAPPSGNTGTSVQATSGGFAPGETVTLTFNSTVVATTMADETGAINVTFTVPTIAPGYYTVVATGTTSQVTNSSVYGVLG